MIAKAILAPAMSLLIILPLHAQAQSTARPAPSLREPGIDRIAAPIALYPDALLAQVLMASTYPLDIAEAETWASRRSSLAPEAIAHAAVSQRWESSVKALLPFTPILTLLRSEKTWTKQLADAVIGQPAALLDAIQRMRERAYDNGTLRSSRQQQVQRQESGVLIDPADRQQIYVPYYDPAQVFSPNGNSLLPPEYWAAQPYAAPANGETRNGIVFSAAIPIPDKTFYDAGIDWRRGRLLMQHTTISATTVGTGAGEWRHDPQYRTRKAATPATGSVSTETPPQTGASIGTHRAGQPSARPGSGTISTQPVRPDRR